MECSGKNTNKSDNIAENEHPCEFCLRTVNDPDNYGKTLIQYGITIHYFCMLFSSGLCQRGKSEKQGILGFLPEDILKEKRRGARLRCSYCKKTGATIGCVVKNCRRAFHLTCGKENGTLHQYFDTYRSYCPDHRPRQAQPVSDRLAFHGTANTMCAICLNSVEARTSDHTLRSPCCRNSWFHRNCVQRFATSAGLYFFKCPLCNNKDSFQDEMLNFGIYIPDQDAAWETEPNAFVELLERYMHCDALLCRCAEGRDYNKDGSKWEIIVCDWCGSKGTHVHCHGLNKIGKEDVCLECKTIGENVSKDKKKRSSKSSTPKNKKIVSIQKSVDQKSKSEYPGPSGKLHKTSLPVVECARKDILHITDAETDAEIDVCSVQNLPCPMQRKHKRKRYRGSLDKLYSAKKKPKLSEPKVHSPIVLENDYQENLTTISPHSCRKAKKRKTYKSKGSLDVLAIQKRKLFKIKQRDRSKALLSSSFTLDSSSKKSSYRTVSATITSPRDLDKSSGDTCGPLVINYNQSWWCDSPTKQPANTSNSSADPPILSPPFTFSPYKSRSMNDKGDDIPPVLSPEKTLSSKKSKTSKPNSFFNLNRQSPRLVAQKKIERRKSAVDKMSGLHGNNGKQSRRRSLQSGTNQPSIMQWFHSDKQSVLDQEASYNDKLDPVGKCEPSGPSSQKEMNNTSKNERKTLVIKWRDKKIIVKPTGKEIVTISGKKLASTKSSKPSKPICAVAPSPRSRPIQLPKRSPVEESNNNYILPSSSNGFEKRDVGDWQDYQVGLVVNKSDNLKMSPTFVGRSYKSPSLQVLPFEQTKERSVSRTRTPHSAAVKHFSEDNDIISSETCKAKCSLSRKFTKVDATEDQMEESKDYRSFAKYTCLLSEGGVVPHSFSCKSSKSLCCSIPTFDRKPQLQMCEDDPEDDHEISFKSNGSGEWSMLSEILTTDNIMAHNMTNSPHQFGTSNLSEKGNYGKKISLNESEILISSDESDTMSLTGEYEIPSYTNS